jgi:5,6-dimethylbenzimidazole synthase
MRFSPLDTFKFLIVLEKTNGTDGWRLDFYEAVDKRHSVREFQAKPVEKEKILRVLAAGLKAPSHNHLREWEFILISDPMARMRIVTLGAKAKDTNGLEELSEKTAGMTGTLQKEMYLKAFPVQKKMLLSSPELLVVCFRNAQRKGESLFELNGFASVWACIENILLAMAAEGLYGVTYVPHDAFPLKRELEIPEDYDVAALIPIGYPANYFVKQKPLM